MKKISFLLTILLISATTAFAQSSVNDKILGIWLSENKDGKVEIYRTGNKYFGKLIWSKHMYEADGKKSRKDEKNSNPQLRNRNLKDLVMLTNLTYDDGVWSGGKIYDPASGKTYSCTMKLDGNTLNIRGFIGISLIGKTSAWTRVQ